MTIALTTAFTPASPSSPGVTFILNATFLHPCAFYHWQFLGCTREGCDFGLIFSVSLYDVPRPRLMRGDGLRRWDGSRGPCRHRPFQKLETSVVTSQVHRLS